VSGRPTMRDVASTAGVSLKTVSRVVNAEPGVAQETAARVTAAIETLGFTRNELARSLRHGRAGALGLVIEDVANPFYSQLARTVEELAHAQGHLLLTGSCGEDPAREQELVLRFLRRAVDAVLMVPAGEDHTYLRGELTQPGHAPIVFLDRPPVGIDVDTVLGDSRGGARTAVEHLVAHGHRKIAVITDSDRVWTARERVAGAADALRDAGLDVDPELIVPGAHAAGDAEAAVRRVLALPAERRPTALFTANNRITVGAVRALRDLDPDDQPALVGFDDFELADMLATPVSVVRQAPAEMARLAAEAAYARLDGDEQAPRRMVVPCELVARGSGERAPR
jgi:LacI family transcriptional regulator